MWFNCCLRRHTEYDDKDLPLTGQHPRLSNSGSSDSAATLNDENELEKEYSYSINREPGATREPQFARLQKNQPPVRKSWATSLGFAPQTPMNNVYNIECDGVPETLERLLALHGRPTHAAMLDKSYSLYIPPDHASVICFKVAQKVAVVYGDPLCAAEHMPGVFQNFRKHCRAQGWKTAIVGAGPEMADHGREAKWGLMEFGVEHVINPQTNPGFGRTINRWNRNLQKEGVSLKVYSPKDGLDPQLERDLMQVYADWRQSRVDRHLPQAYSTVLNPFALRTSRHLYTLGPDGKPNSWACLMQVGGHKGYLIEPCIAREDAGQGTTEFLTTNATRILKEEGLEYLTFGLAPREEMGELSGMNKIIQESTRSLYKTTCKALALNGKQAFHEKFKPDDNLRGPLYLLYPSGCHHLGGVRAVLEVTHISISEVWTRSRAAAAKEKAKKREERKQKRSMDSDRSDRSHGPLPPVAA